MGIITITLANGESYSKQFKGLPRFWKSVAMSLAPYGSDFRNCTFTKARVS